MVEVIQFTVGPIILAIVLWFMQRITNRENWKREDAVRVANETRQDRLEANVVTAKEKAEEAATLLAANNELVAQSTSLMSQKIDGVHDLVNSDKTEAMRVLLEQLILSLEMMKEIRTLRQAAGQGATVPGPYALDAVEARIAQLTSEVAERDRLQAITDANPHQVFPPHSDPPTMSGTFVITPPTDAT